MQSAPVKHASKQARLHNYAGVETSFNYGILRGVDQLPAGCLSFHEEETGVAVPVCGNPINNK